MQRLRREREKSSGSLVTETSQTIFF